MAEAAAPGPRYEGLFLEPAYWDGPYDRGDEEDILDDPAIITP